MSYYASAACAVRRGAASVCTRVTACFCPPRPRSDCTTCTAQHLLLTSSWFCCPCALQAPCPHSSLSRPTPRWRPQRAGPPASASSNTHNTHTASSSCRPPPGAPLIEPPQPLLPPSWPVCMRCPAGPGRPRLLLPTAETCWSPAPARPLQAARQHPRLAPRGRSWAWWASRPPPPPGQAPCQAREGGLPPAPQWTIPRTAWLQRLRRHRRQQHLAGRWQACPTPACSRLKPCSSEAP